MRWCAVSEAVVGSSCAQVKSRGLEMSRDLWSSCVPKLPDDVSAGYLPPPLHATRRTSYSSTVPKRGQGSELRHIFANRGLIFQITQKVEGLGPWK